MKHPPDGGPVFPFDGETYVPDRDHQRLRTQLQKVFFHLLDGGWHKAPLLKKRYGSAADVRVRDLRKSWCGSMTVDERATEVAGVHEYCLDLESVDPVWAQKILNGEVKDPAKKKGPSISDDEMRETLHSMIDKIPGGKLLAQCYRLVKKRLPENSESSENSPFGFLEDL